MPSRLLRFLVAPALLVGALGPPSPAKAQANGRLQIHFMNVGQGDGALLITPRGTTVLFDNGVRNNCDAPVSYLQQLGIQGIDYHVASHYHDDHIGCTAEVLGAYPLRQAAYDRGNTYISETFASYASTVGSLRRTATPGMTLRLDENTPNPVTITFMVVNGAAPNGIQAQTNNENDLSVVAVVRYGHFDAVFGGDLSGYRTSSYRDIETPVATAIGPVELYKVNHHGSAHSSNDTWLAALTPRVGIISAGLNSKHGHPTQEAIDRLHAANVRTYWTTQGKGEVQPVNGRDVVGNNIIVEVAPGASTFSVTYAGNRVDTHPMLGASGPGNGETLAYAWSTRSQIYHHADCVYVDNISPANLARGNEPPTDKRLHDDCPRHGGGQ
ncbi:MAG TPA: MBL fold metallo-hydrolase [Gemmatimonadaceae bacterium]|nr:MBL fold metallo-hydrolase [Gemmatimonadaceae bacterium]